MIVHAEAEILGDAAPLEDEWWDLWARDPHATPFQSPAWLLPWRRHFSDGTSIVLTIRQNDRLSGLLPLFALEGRLLPWGAGNSDYLGGIFDPALDPFALTVGMKRLAPWGKIDLFQLADGSKLLDMPPPKGWRDRRGQAEPCPVLELPARLPRNMAQNLRYYRRRAERAGTLRLERVGHGSLDILVDLHAARWQGKGQPGVLADDRVLAHLADALPALEAAGLLRLYALRLDGRAVAALYALTAKRRSYYYLGGFDPQFGRLGLGTVIVGHAIAEAEREGSQAFDFLRGQEPYKYHWGAVDRPTHARSLTFPEA